MKKLEVIWYILYWQFHTILLFLLVLWKWDVGYISLSQMKLKIYLIELVKLCRKGVMCWICLTNDNRILYLNKMELQKMRGKTFKRNRQYYWPWTKTWIIFEMIMLLFKLNVGFSNILKTSKQNLNSVDKSK